MESEYPRRNRFLIFQREKDGVLLRHSMSEEEWIIPEEIAAFIRALDGKTSPYDLGLDPGDVDDLLDFMEEKDLLDDGHRGACLGFGSGTFTLFIPEIRSSHRRAGKAWNRFLMASWLPVFFLGILLQMMLGTETTEYTDYDIVIGFVLGLLFGIVLHELSHAAAALHYGGSLLEMGLFVIYFMPGAYCAIDYENVKNHFHRAQITAAGIESNLLQCGLCLVLFQVVPTDAFLEAALMNWYLSILNLSLALRMDGARTFEEFLCCDNFSGRAKVLLRDRRQKQKLRKQGINGRATIAACCLIRLLQVQVPLLILLEVTDLILTFLS